MTENLRDNTLEILSSLLCEKTELLLHEFGVKIRRSGNKYYGKCPVHGGDNVTAWNYYPNDDNTRMPIWRCRTHNCHVKYKQTVFGLIQGVLSRQQNREVSFQEVISWVKNWLGVKDLKADKVDLAKKIAIHTHDFLHRKVQETTTGWTREQIRDRLDIPAHYYLNRKFKQDLLDRYDVGVCKNPKKIFQNRVVVPVYDSHYKYVAGFTGRSIWDKCSQCKCYHNPKDKCPLEPSWLETSKWVNNKGFDARNYLYGYWFSRDSIKETGVAVLVEGPPDVWRLVENGITNVVGMFGTDLTEEQRLILETSGALSLVVMTDSDEPGRKAAEIIKQQCGRLYRLYFPKISAKDAGEMTGDMVTKEIKPLLDKIAIC